MGNLFDSIANWFNPPHITSPLPLEGDLNPGPQFKDSSQAVAPKQAVLAAQTPVPTATPTPPPDNQLPATLAPVPNDPGESYNNTISAASKQTGVPPALLKGVLAHESWQFNPKYVGGYHTDGSGRGIAAIDKNAHPEISDQQAFNPSFAIPWAARTLANYHQQEGNWFNALRRYNGGGNYAVNTPGYAGVPVAQRTHDYAMNVLNQAKRFSGFGSNANKK